MSRSLKRVLQVLDAAGSAYVLRETEQGARTARDAADTVGCELDQIAKSIVVEGARSGDLALFITAGGNRVCTTRVADLLGESTHPASGTRIREITGFAIGGVAPIGHKTPIRAWLDPRLEEFGHVWAAAGTPRHVFRIAPAELRTLSGATVADFVET